MKKGKVIQLDEHRKSRYPEMKGINKGSERSCGLMSVHESDSISGLMENLRILALIQEYGAEAVSNVLESMQNTDLEEGL